MFTTIDAIGGKPINVIGQSEETRNRHYLSRNANEDDDDDDHHHHHFNDYNDDKVNEEAEEMRITSNLSGSSSVDFYKFRAHHSSIRDIQVSNNSIFTASDDRTTKVWNIDDFSLMKTLKGHSHIVSSIALSHDSNHMLTSSFDKTIRLWDLEKYDSSSASSSSLFSQNSSQKSHHSAAVLCVAISNDNRVIVSGGADNKVLMWNVKGNVKAESKLHSGFVNYLQFNPGFSDILYSCSEDATVLAYNLEKMTMKPYATITGSSSISPVICLDSSPDSSLIATITKEDVFFYEGCMGEYIASYKLPLTSNSSNLALKSKNSKSSSKLLGSATGSKLASRGSCVKFNPCEVWIAYSFGNSLQVHYLSESKLAASFSIANEDDFPSAKYTKFTWSKDGKTLFAAATDGYVRVYKFHDN